MLFASLGLALTVSAVGVETVVPMSSQPANIIAPDVGGAVQAAFARDVFPRLTVPPLEVEAHAQRLADALESAQLQPCDPGAI